MIKLIWDLVSLSTFSSMFNISTYTQHNFYSPSPKMCQSLRAQLSKLWQSHMNSALSFSFYLHFYLSFLSCSTHLDCPPPKQISAERGKSKPRPQKFSTRCRSVKLAWQYSLWGEGGSRSVASHSVRWTCTGGRAGEREKERTVSCESTVKRKGGVTKSRHIQKNTRNWNTEENEDEAEQ